MTPRPSAPGTLADVRVADLTRVLPGPFAAMVTGEHTGGILPEAGYDDGKIAALRAAGVVR